LNLSSKKDLQDLLIQKMGSSTVGMEMPSDAVQLIPGSSRAFSYPDKGDDEV
jgi:hypothetical protein